MAFGKKKGDEPLPGDLALDDAPLFPDEGAEAELASAETEPVTAEAPVEAPVAEAPAPAEAAMPSADSLLSAFQTSEGAGEDRSMLVDLAGDVELADILEELNTLAAAMNIVRS